MSTKPLIECLRALGLPAPAVAGEAAITGVTSDSRQVTPGMAFVAIAGTKMDGTQFIADAVARGAGLVVAEGAGVQGVPAVLHPNPRLALAKLSALLYAPQPAHAVAVTGTDGKTSTADFFRQLAAFAGRKAASIGTLGVLGAGAEQLAPGESTTPDAPSLHRLLARMAADNYTHVAMEASSHGLHQYRLDGVRLEAAAFTNLTRDHLDYHGTDEAYFAAKARLFSEVMAPGATAVLNADDPRFGELHHLTILHRRKLITYGREASDLIIHRTAPHPQGQRVEIEVFGKPFALDLPHVGAFQLYNMLAALGLLAATGEDARALAARLPELAGVPGRLERVAVHASGAALYIDYAHTPAALAGVLRTLRPHTAGRLIVVFGCGGDRDKGKRPLMGQAAAELADITIVTDDNPRGEDAATIRAEVLAAASGAKEVAGRERAIYAATALLQPGDVLLVAGKGHEKTQIIGSQSHPFDDAEILRNAG